MSQAVLNLKFPEDVLERVRRAAAGMNQPVETALVNIVKAAAPSLEKVPAKYRKELETMEDWSDADLWKATEESLAARSARQLERLLEKNAEGQLDERERRTLRHLRGQADRLMLRRSYALLLLKYRGRHVPALASAGWWPPARDSN